MSNICRGCDEQINDPETNLCEQCEELAMLNLLDPTNEDEQTFSEDCVPSELDEYDQWLDEVEAARELGVTLEQMGTSENPDNDIT